MFYKNVGYRKIYIFELSKRYLKFFDESQYVLFCKLFFDQATLSHETHGIDKLDNRSNNTQFKIIEV